MQSNWFMLLCFNINNNKGNTMSSTFSLGSTITGGCLLYDNFSPLTLFAAGEQGYWLDASDFSTMFQDDAGTTPVTAVGQSVGLWLDKSKGLTLGPELRGTGTTVLAGTATAATYNTLTGEGSANRVSPVDQSGVNFNPGVSSTYLLNISNTGGANITIRRGNVLGAFFLTVAPGATRSVYVNAASEVTITPSADSTTVTFTVNSIRELPGNHFIQSNVANRPILGREPLGGTRNLLPESGFTNLTSGTPGGGTIAGFSRTFADGSQVVTPNDASLGGASVRVAATSARHIWTTSPPFTDGTTVTLSADIEVHSGSLTVLQIMSFPQITSSNIIALRDGVSQSVSSALPLGRYTLAVTTTVASTGALQIRFGIGLGANATGDVTFRDIQLEFGSARSAYQRTDNSGFSVVEAGVPTVHYLAFDGSDDFLTTAANINPGAVDKVQAFAGVRKLSDAVSGMLVESGSDAGTTNGSFFMQAPSFNGANSYRFLTRGSGAALAGTGTFAPAPVTSVLTGLGDIAGDNVALRVNGTQVAQSSVDQGTGNFATQTHFIGRRAGTSFPFNGRIYQLITRFGPNLPQSTIIQTEIFTNQRTGAY
jgi:hypothetical protein